MDIANEKIAEIGEQLEAGHAELQQELNNVFAELKAVKDRKQLLESRLASQAGALALMARLIEMEEEEDSTGTFTNELGVPDDG
jgi:hypothetical protein